MARAAAKWLRMNMSGIVTSGGSAERGLLRFGAFRCKRECQHPSVLIALSLCEGDPIRPATARRDGVPEGPLSRPLQRAAAVRRPVAVVRRLVAAGLRLVAVVRRLVAAVHRP